MTKVKVAAVQMCSGVSVQKNVERMRALVTEAAAQGATYVQTPEMTGALQTRPRVADGLPEARGA